MYSERLRKFKANGSRINDTFDLKWHNKTGRRFFGFHIKWDVPSVEPNLLTRLVHWSRSPPLVRQPLILVTSAQESRSGLLLEVVLD